MYAAERVPADIDGIAADLIKASWSFEVPVEFDEVHRYSYEEMRDPKLVRDIRGSKLRLIAIDKGNQELVFGVPSVIPGLKFNS